MKWWNRKARCPVCGRPIRPQWNHASCIGRKPNPKVVKYTGW